MSKPSKKEISKSFVKTSVLSPGSQLSLFSTLKEIPFLKSGIKSED
jgi:hypothetical protein